MILFIILTLMFKSSLSLLDPPPYPFITSMHVSDVDPEELIEVYEEAPSTQPAPSATPTHSKVTVQEATKKVYETLMIEEDEELVEVYDDASATNQESETKAECQVYEEIIGQIFELVHARNSTSGYQYRLLRATIDDLHLFDICYEVACMGGLGKATRTRGGRFFLDKDHFDKDKTEPKKKVYVQTWNDRDFCRKSDFCRTCPYSSSCCNDWCWKTCYDEDIRNPNYCNLWRSSDLCKKINHCQCNLDHGDCFGGGTKKYHESGSTEKYHGSQDKHSSSSGTWSTWSNQDGWYGNGRPSEYFGSDNSGWGRDRYRGGNRGSNGGRNRYRGGGRPRNRDRGGNRRRYDDYDYGRYDRNDYDEYY